MPEQPSQTNEELKNRLRETEKQLKSLYRDINHHTPYHPHHDRLLAIFRSAPVGIGLMRQRVIEEVNPLLCEILGYQETELVGSKSRILYSTDTEFERVGHEITKQIGSLGQSRFETTWHKKDGTPLCILLSSTPIDPAFPDEEIIFSILDITLQKRLENTLQRMAVEYASLAGKPFFEAICLHLCELFRTDYAFVGETSGSNRMHVLGGIAKGAPLTPFDYELADTPCEQVLGRQFCFYDQNAQTLFPQDLLLRQKGMISYAGISLLGKENKPLGILAMLHSAELRDEAEIRLIFNLFSTRVAAEIQRLQDEETRLKLERRVMQSQKLESLGVLSGGIAHDFNNILTAILGQADLACHQLPVDNSGLKKNLEEIRKGSERAADLCQQMLAYSGKGRFRLKPVNLSLLIEEIQPLILSSFSKNIHLSLQLAPDMPCIEADGSQINQMVMSLVNNASEAIGSKSGEIIIATGTVAQIDEVTEQTTSPGDKAKGPFAWISVSDTGCGIPAKIRNRIFEPFFTTKFAGRGLSMSAVLGIVRGHQGILKLKTQEGQGTQFIIYFPVTSEISQYSPLPHEDYLLPDDNPIKALVLLVDDEEMVRTVATEMLIQLGHTVICARDGFEALDLFRQHQAEIDLVVLDLTMPNMNGEETFAGLKAINNSLPIILSSGFSENEISQRFQGLTIQGFIEKPYTLKQMQQQVSRVLKLAKKNPR